MKTTNVKATPMPYAKRWAALAVLCTAQFMVIMDTSIIGVALPAIQKDLGYTASSLQWIFNAYVILFGGLLLLGGKLSDIYGPRKIFMTGFTILTASSLLAGLAWNPSVLNAARALQGFGSALIAPAALTLVMSMFTDPKEMAKAFGFWGASAAAGGSAGVFLGGLLTEWVSWQWVFYINIPMGILVMLAAPSLLLTGTKQKGSVDLPGALLATTALIALVYAIVTGEQAGWTSAQTIGLLVTALVLIIAFIQLQKQKKQPLIPLSIFKAFNLSAGNIVMALMAAAWIPLWFYLNLYLQQTLKLSAFNSGLALLPMTLVIMVLMVGVTGKLIQKLGFKSNLVMGLLALTVSLFWFSAAPENGSFVAHILGPSILAAIGMALAYIPGTIAAMSGAKPEETGLASGLVNTSYQIGSAIGLAIAVAIATSTANTLASNGTAMSTALNNSFQIAFIVAGIISLLAALCAILFVKTPKTT
ncbi:MAG: MFS transporter [Bacteroidetes bacterium]|nr:MAG: MFS transporter [Bacteroidota bacterium]